MTTTTATPNRLAEEKSPYLLQHAYNPVEWYPWSEEAFEKACDEDKPVFVSIGYSTCHWCHVMERESFEDEEVAKVLNDNFIAIKVDREERPDIDHVYMDVCQALTGHGGWPLSVFLTPNKLPFYAGTYFPKQSRYGSIGFIELLENIRKAWTEKKDKLINSGKNIKESIESYNKMSFDKGEVDEQVFHKAFKQLEQSFEKRYGGFSKAPKFPMPGSLIYLMYYYHFYSSNEAKNMLEKTLNSMYKGGIFDHLGGGFSRYSTDQKWLVPHFEKMLYDNALLIYAYTKFYCITEDECYKHIVEEVIDYIVRDMQDSEGGFYCAEDADSEGEEGLFYIWDYDEIIEILGEDEGKAFAKYYNVTKEGNFEGKNILNLIDKDKETIKKNIKSNKFKDSKKKLFRTREKRIHPHKDDKILTSWNGLMIVGIAYASRAFYNDEYRDVAKKSADFILDKLTTEDGEVFIRYRDGEIKKESFVDDYSFFVWGLLELYESTLDKKYLDKAIKIFNYLMDKFFDNDSSSFYMTKDQGEMGLRPKETYDGAVPSGNSVGLLVMLKIARITEDYKLEEKVYNFYEKHMDILMSSPISYTFSLISLMLMLNPVQDIVIAPNDSQNIDGINNFIGKLSEKAVPYLSLKISTPKDIKKPIEGKTTIYVCHKGECLEPLTDLELALKTIK
ncbi:MAG: thioredoxin domain-containing protein [Eubacteriales bacterium]